MGDLGRSGCNVHVVWRPPFSQPPTYPPTQGTMLLHAMPIAILAYVEAYSISKKYADMYR